MAAASAPAQLSGHHEGKEPGGAKDAWGGDSIGTPRKGRVMVVRSGGTADGTEDMGRVIRCFGMGRQPILLGGVNAMDTNHTFVLITSMFVF